jgi:glycosyltransferase
VAILNSDDFYSNENVITNVVDKLLESKALILYADVYFVDRFKKNKIVRKWIGRKGNFLFGWNPPHPSMIVERSIYKEYGLYNPNFKISSDYDFMLRTLYLAKLKYFYFKTTIVKMRVGGESTKSWISHFNGSKEIYSILKLNKIRFPLVVVFLRIIRKIKQFKIFRF